MTITYDKRVEDDVHFAIEKIQQSFRVLNGEIMRLHRVISSKRESDNQFLALNIELRAKTEVPNEIVEAWDVYHNQVLSGIPTPHTLSRIIDGHCKSTTVLRLKEKRNVAENAS